MNLVSGNLALNFNSNYHRSPNSLTPFFKIYLTNEKTFKNLKLEVQLGDYLCRVEKRYLNTGVLPKNC